jgi:uncharacterized membrane protein
MVVVKGEKSLVMNNAAHFHLLINHFPIILPMVGFCLLIIGFVLKSEVVKRIAYGIFIVASATGFLAMNSGSGAEEIVERLGRKHHIIHEHEELAEKFAFMTYTLGLFSIIAFWLNWKKKPFKELSMFLVALIALVVIFLARGVGQSGGEISHKEITTYYSK